MSFPVMIHLKSTLAISAIMLTGLVAASPFPYASDYEPRQPRHTATAQIAPAVEAATTPAAVTAWADPPAKTQTPAERPVRTAAVETPAPVVEEAAAAAPAAVPASVRHVSAQAKAEQARRRKIARLAARDRRMALREQASHTAAGTEAQTASRAASNTSQKIDPIGDILRGLGIGKEG